MGVRFHAPNSLFASMITPRVAQLMRAMGMETVRVSLESASSAQLDAWNRRITPSHFIDAMRNLGDAGFTRDQIGVYLLCGLPGQQAGDVREAIDTVIAHGGTPRLAEYSPIPGTPEFDRAVEFSALPLKEEPLLHNNTIFHWAAKTMSPEELASLKRHARESQSGMGVPPM
jgi:radical SAM superfamily enzyme YgiQ (UPF0313 family)